MAGPRESLPGSQAISATSDLGARVPQTAVRSVLVVEDEPDAADLVRAMLAHAGAWRVQSTHRLDEALDLLAHERFDVVVLDLNLPDSSGLETVARLTERAPDLAVVVTSALHGLDNSVEAVRLGAQDFLSKGSFDAQMLRRSLLLAIERKRGSVSAAFHASALDKLAEAEDRYRMLFDANPHPMWVFDLETLGFLAVNEAACLHYGYTRDEFLARTIDDIRLAEDAAALRSQMSDPGSGPRSAGTWRHRKKDGSLIDVEVSSHPLSFGDRPACLVLLQDITERRQFEERARQHQEMEAIGRLAGGVAHDFNNVLAVITGCAEMILRVGAKDPTTTRRADEILKATASAARLTQQLLASADPDPSAPTSST